jgi:hypothetical protein
MERWVLGSVGSKVYGDNAMFLLLSREWVDVE